MRILSIQSHVVSGYVGNRAATFPLQLLGHDVDVINTVQFSNHTGYGHTDGHQTTPEQLEAIFSGLKKNELDKYDRVLTGYIPGAAALSVVKAHVEGLRPEVYLLDPVMGDIGTGLYVSPDVVPVYKSMLRDATIITPNHFELELLSGVKISTFDDLRKALTTLHEEIPHIAVSSISLPRRLLPDLPPPPTAYTALVPENADWYSAIDRNPENVLVCVASSKSKVFVFALPTIDAYFSGVGDLFAALVLGFFAGDLAQAVGKALYAVQMVLLRTHLNPNQATNMRARELRLVQEQEHIRSGLEWPGIHV